MRRRNVITLAALPLLAGGPGLAGAQAQHHAPAPASAAIGNLNEAVNQAGRQRMLSQRLAKAWLAIGQQIETDRARRLLADSAALFERQLLALQAFAPPGPAATTYAALGEAWAEYRQALANLAPSVSNTPRLVTLDGKVLALAHRGTLDLEALTAQPVTRWVNLAGRQRMLSQRLAKYFLVRRWQAAVPDAASQTEQASLEFSTALGQLQKAPEANSAIQDQLQLGQQQWVFFANALAQVNSAQANAHHATDVFSSSENLLQVMDRVTGLFARQGVG